MSETGGPGEGRLFCLLFFFGVSLCRYFKLNMRPQRHLTRALNTTSLSLNTLNNKAG